MEGGSTPKTRAAADRWAALQRGGTKRYRADPAVLSALASFQAGQTPPSIIVCGLDTFGRRVARAAGAAGHTIVGALDPDFSGTSTGGVGIVRRVNQLRAPPGSVVLHTPLSTLSGTAQQVGALLARGFHVACASPSLSFPTEQPGRLEELHEIALKNGVTLVGVRINPAWIANTLPLQLRELPQDRGKVKLIEIHRVVSPQGWSDSFKKQIWADALFEDFQAAELNHRLADYPGLKESAIMVACVAGFSFGKIEITRPEPLLSVNDDRRDILVGRDIVEGIRQSATVFDENNVKRVELSMAISTNTLPNQGVEALFVQLEKGPTIELSFPRENDEDAVRSALLDAIPRVGTAQPGFRLLPQLLFPQLPIVPRVAWE